MKPTDPTLYKMEAQRGPVALWSAEGGKLWQATTARGPIQDGWIADEHEARRDFERRLAPSATKKVV